jgi:curved DNA-binding protein CbpA
MTAGGMFIDYYEILQISPNADLDTIHRVYRYLAQRFHPDNKDTGSDDMFRTITAAYNVLSDPVRRAAFDVEHRDARRLTWKIFDQSNSASGVEAEKRKRQGVLALLYRKRVAQADQATMSLREMEDLLGIPKEHLEFTLWYLKEGQYVKGTDNARYMITLKGVDLAEDLIRQRPEITPVAYINSAQVKTA